MIRALIVEDEIPAQINLKRLIDQNVDDVVVVATADSIESACAFLSTRASQIDIIFMDVELSDGMCFEIFNRVEIKAKVIITTAYNNYAIKAFKVNSIDYLLKPIEPQELINAIDRARKAVAPPAIDVSELQKAIGIHLPKNYKQRITIKVGDKIIILNIDQIAYFYSEDKSTYVVTFDEKKYIMDQSLDTIIEMLNPTQFFRISRGVIASIGSIKSVSKHFNSRLKITLTPRTDIEIFVSRVRIPEFMEWLEA